MEQVSPTVVWPQVRAAFAELLATRDELPDTIETDLDAVLAGSESDLDAARAYAARLGATLATAPQGHAFFNGKHFDLDDVRSMLFAEMLMDVEADCAVV